MKKKLLSVVTGCLNEAGNIGTFYDRVRTVLDGFPQYDHEIIVADNCSTDGTRDILRRIAASDRRFRVILNANNFGPVRSGYNAFLQASGDAVVLMSSDLQDPPELIADLIRKWEEGYQVVAAVRTGSGENQLLFAIRRLYYGLLSRFADSVPVIPNFNGFGLYDRKFMAALRRYNEPLPYLRGLVSEIGFRRTEVGFVQPRRRAGRSKHGFLTLYDVAMSGVVGYSRLPLRLATFAGFALAGISLLIALGYLALKLLYWDTFFLGLAPVLIGLFFFAAVQLIFIGIIGEYVGAILTQVKNHPLAIEDERLNFDLPGTEVPRPSPPVSPDHPSG